MIGFIGTGNMGSAIIRGILKTLPPPLVCACSKTGKSAHALSSELGIIAYDDIETLVAHSDTIILACKPHQLGDLHPEFAKITADKLIISVLAGRGLSKLNEHMPNARNLIWAMPNTPSQIGEGMTGYCSFKPLTEKDGDMVKAILGSLGPVIEVSEDKMDVVTGVSGSGPAYVFAFTQAMMDVAEEFGIDGGFGVQTVIGAAELMKASGLSPKELINEVTSKGGTTSKGLEALDENDLHGVVRSAIIAAKNRSKELSNEA